MKLLLLPFIILSFFISNNLHAQEHISQEAFDHYWNSLSEHNHAYSEQKIEDEKIELSKIKNLLYQNIHKELAEVKELSSDVITNFAIIEDHFHQEFEALGLLYTSYEHHENNSNMPKVHWVNHHTNKIIEHKLARVEKEMKEIYD